MRPTQQVRAVSPYLEFLEEQKVLLTPLLTTINSAIEETSNWVDEKDGSNKTFMEIMQDLDLTNTLVLKQYSTILKENQHDIPSSETAAENSTKPFELGKFVKEEYATKAEFDLLLQRINKMDDILRVNVQQLDQNQAKNVDVSKALDDQSKTIQTKQKLLSKKIKTNKTKVQGIEKNLEQALHQMEEQKNVEAENSNRITEFGATLLKTRTTVTEVKKQLDNLTADVDKTFKELSTKSELQKLAMNNLSETQQKFVLNINEIKTRNDSLDLKCASLSQMLSQRVVQTQIIKSIVSKHSKRLREIDTKFVDMDTKVGHLEFKVDLHNDATGFRYTVIYNRGNFDPLDGKFDLSRPPANGAEEGLYLFIINERTCENIKLKLILSLYEEDFLENEFNFINIGDKHHSGMLLVHLDGYDNVKLRMLQADRNKVMQGGFLCYKL